jgi:hypothetical protein
MVGGPGKRILDLGCRTGSLTRVCASGNEVVGVDVDRGALHEAARLGIETVWADPCDVLGLLGAFVAPRLEFVVGRFVRLNARQFANVIVFSARAPG